MDAPTIKDELLSAALSKCEALRTENGRLRSALQRIRNTLHAHNRPDHPLPNQRRLALRDIADLALEQD